MSDLLNALDLPADLLALQTRFWEAEREWEALLAAYKLVAEDMLERSKRSEDE